MGKKREETVRRSRYAPVLNKFSAEKVELDGMAFDSKKEAATYWQLKMAERAGEIANLRRQVKYELIPAQKDARGKLIERAVHYIADFEYDELKGPRKGEHVVMDVKGMRTREYVIKRKLMLYVHGVRIYEV